MMSLFFISLLMMLVLVIISFIMGIFYEGGLSLFVQFFSERSN